MNNLARERNAILATLQTRYDAEKAKSDALAQAIEMIRAAYRADGSSAPERTSGVPWARTPWHAHRLVGLSQKDALIDIAEGNGGFVRVMDACDLFLEAGLSRSSRKNLQTLVTHILLGMHEFERVAPGLYRLRSPA